jgi:hypothetical protein
VAAACEHGTVASDSIKERTFLTSLAIFKGLSKYPGPLYRYKLL